MAPLTQDLAAFRDQVEAELAFRQPRLEVRLEGGLVIAEGTFLVAPHSPEHRDAGALAAYEVRVEIDPAFPKVEPRVFETGGRIERSTDFHINPDGACCVTVWETWRGTPDVSIGGYFDGPLRNYFLSQHSVALGGEWPFGEWAHGAEGLVTAYAERLGCPADGKAVTRFLKGYLKVLRRDRMPVFWLCPCQSGRAIGSCCLHRIEALMEIISAPQAQAMLDRLSDQLKPTKKVAYR